ncbi:MAG: phage holin family protein [Pyrinomonadaceae bacterium]
MEQLQKVKEERSLGDLFSELSKETSTLMRQEVNLAQVEITQKATIVGKQVGSLVVGGAVGYAALLIILLALVIGLSQLISAIFGWTIITSAWVAAAIIGLIVGGVAFSLITSALATLKKPT